MTSEFIPEFCIIVSNAAIHKEFQKKLFFFSKCLLHLINLSPSYDGSQHVHLENFFIKPYLYYS